jgi:GDPmannose 4,6-dehydratase
MVKAGLITGVNGQDGSYLAELLLEKGYEVYGLVRRSSHLNLERIKTLVDHRRFHVVYGDLGDASTIHHLLQRILTAHEERIEVYNLAAQSHVGVSFGAPIYTAQVDAICPLVILEAIRCLDTKKQCRFYQASTSELYGKVLETPQNETTPFNPQSPYAIAKEFAFSTTKLYREAYGMFAVNGILFNHESERRGHEFLTRKVSLGVAAIVKGQQDHLEIGNLDAQRDWGYAPEYVDLMWRMLQAEEPEDYVAATGKTQSVRYCVEKAFEAAGIRIEWSGSGVREVGKDVSTGEILVKVNPVYFRPAEVDLLLGDYAKAKARLGWEPKTTFEDLIKKMVCHDMS